MQVDCWDGAVDVSSSGEQWTAHGFGKGVNVQGKNMQQMQSTDRGTWMLRLDCMHHNHHTTCFNVYFFLAYILHIIVYALSVHFFHSSMFLRPKQIKWQQKWAALDWWLFLYTGEAQSPITDQTQWSVSPAPLLDHHIPDQNYEVYGYHGSVLYWQSLRSATDAAAMAIKDSVNDGEQTWGEGTCFGRHYCFMYVSGKENLRCLIMCDVRICCASERTVCISCDSLC